MSLIEAFDIHRGELISLVGGGGKSSLMFGLAQSWPGRVVLTTTTRLFRAQVGRAQSWVTLKNIGQLGEKLARHRSCLVVGPADVHERDKVTGVSADWPARLLARPDVEIVVVEADGSRRRPVKAPAEHEPMIPPETTLGIIVVGIDALERPIAEVAHRPQLVCGLTGLSPEQNLTPAALTKLLTDQNGGLKGMPPGARIAICLNKIETPPRAAAAAAVADQLLLHEPIERVVLTSLQAEIAVRRVFVKP